MSELPPVQQELNERDRETVDVIAKDLVSGNIAYYPDKSSRFTVDQVIELEFVIETQEDFDYWKLQVFKKRNILEGGCDLQSHANMDEGCLIVIPKE